MVMVDHDGRLFMVMVDHDGGCSMMEGGSLKRVEHGGGDEEWSMVEGGSW